VENFSDSVDLNKEGLLLTPSDWHTLMASTVMMTFEKDAKIIEQGEVHNRLFQIAKGTCRIEKQNQILGKMQVNDIFGEISLLLGGTATASVIVDSDSVELYAFEGYFIDILYACKPALAAKFFYYLSTLLSARFDEREKKIRK